MLACAVLAARANTDIVSLYNRLAENPNYKTANKLMSALYELGAADSLILFSDDEDPQIMVATTTSMSAFYFDKGKYREAIRMNEQAMQFTKRGRDDSYIIDNYMLMAVSYYYLSDLRKSIQLNLKALSVADKSGTSVQLSFAYHNLASAYSSLNDNKMARKYIQKAIEVEENAGIYENLPVTYNSAAEILRLEKRFPEALKYLRKAIALVEKSGDPFLRAALHLRTGVIYRDLKEYSNAREEIEKALPFFEENEPRAETAECFLMYGDVMTQLKFYDTARTYLTKAEKLALQMDSKMPLVSIYSLLANIEKQGNPQLAIDYLLKRDEVKDTLYSSERNKMVYDSEMKYETATKELTIRQQQHEIDRRNIWLVIIISIFCFAIMSIIVAIVFLNGRRKSRYAELLRVERDDAQAARDETRHALDLLERANSLKDVFIDNVVHELRTPINAIQGFSQMLAPSMGSTPEEVNEYLEIINDNCRSLITIVQDTIDVFELEDMNYKVTPTELTIESLCRSAMLSEQMEFNRSVANGTSEFTSRDNVNVSIVQKEDFLIRTDSFLFSRMLGNVISNALKYTAYGSITIEAHKGLWSERQGLDLKLMFEKAVALGEFAQQTTPWNINSIKNATPEDISTDPIPAGAPANTAFVEPDGGDGPVPTFSVTVTDTGCGIAKEDAEKIFNRFEKLGSYVPGNGMGLTITRLIAHLFKGEAYLDTTYTGTGSRFVIEMQSLKPGLA